MNAVPNRLLEMVADIIVVRVLRRNTENEILRTARNGDIETVAVSNAIVPNLRLMIVNVVLILNLFEATNPVHIQALGKNLSFTFSGLVFRSRSMSAEGERDYSPREKVEEPRQEEPQDHPKKSSLSPQSGRHESDPLFHPAASPVQDP